jgi:hypothetical protein
MVLGILAVLIGGGLCAAVTRSLFGKTVPQLRAARRGASAEGKVLHIKVQHMQGDNLTTRPLDVRFADVQFSTADGRRVRYLQHLEMGLACNPGDVVTVHYDPADPADSATTESPYDVTTTLMVKAGTALFFALFFAYGLLIVVGVVHPNQS